MKELTREVRQGKREGGIVGSNKELVKEMEIINKGVSDVGQSN